MWWWVYREGGPQCGGGCTERVDHSVVVGVQRGWTTVWWWVYREGGPQCGGGCTERVDHSVVVGVQSQVSTYCILCMSVIELNWFLPDETGSRCFPSLDRPSTPPEEGSWGEWTGGTRTQPSLALS